MQTLTTLDDSTGLYLCPVSKIAYEVAIKNDLEFLHAWEDGLFPELSHYLRIRQIRKGNPILIAERLLRRMDVQTTRTSLLSQQNRA